MSMLPPRGTLTMLVASAAFAAGVNAQNNESRGVLAGAATTMLVDGGNAGMPDGETLVHPNGFSQTPPLTFQSTPMTFGAPSLPEIFKLHGDPQGINVDAFSTGRDDLLLNNQGQLNVPPMSWSVWSFSLRSSALGEAGSRIAEEAANGEVGAALFSYIVPGSDLPNEVIDRTERSHSRKELGIDTSPNVEIDGVDFPLILGRDQQLAPAGIGSAIEPGFNALIATPETIYFSVSGGTKNNVPSNWWKTYGGTSPTPPSGASILCTQRIGIGAQLVWSEPRVFLPFWELGLNLNEDLDALAVDTVRNQVLYSVKGTLRDQFLFHYFGPDDGAAPPATPATTMNGEPVSSKVGKSAIDDVDAVCTLDPVIGSVGTPPFGGDDFGSSCGAPQPGLLGTPQISGSAYRRFQNNRTFIDTFMIGWPPTAGAAPGFAAAFLTVGGSLVAIPIGGIHVRNPGGSLPGDPQTESFVVPPSISLTNFDCTCRWIALDMGTGELAEAWPSRLFL